MSLHVLAYNLKRVMQVLGIAKTMKAMSLVGVVSAFLCANARISALGGCKRAHDRVERTGSSKYARRRIPITQITRELK
jgi:hypothetical protein